MRLFRKCNTSYLKLRDADVFSKSRAGGIRSEMWTVDFIFRFDFFYLFLGVGLFSPLVFSFVEDRPSGHFHG